MTFWRKPVRVPIGHRARWDFGNGRVWVERGSGQWLVGATGPGPDDPASPNIDVFPKDSADPADGEPRRRVALGGEERAVDLVPRPPPRPIVARPELPLVVPVGVNATVHVGVPLWFGLEDDGLALDEIPALRLHDTWFGTPTQGELCFATKTHLRLEIGSVPRTPFRALCVIDVRNEGPDPLVLERVRLPAPSLAIYLDGEDRPWTSPVRLRRERTDEGREVTEVVPKPPPGCRLVGPARSPLAAPLLGRVFNAMFAVGGVS